MTLHFVDCRQDGTTIKFLSYDTLHIIDRVMCIIIMTVLVVQPVVLELNKIRAGHKSATDLALTLMEHLTAIYVILDAASVLMIAPQLPEPSIK